MPLQCPTLNGIGITHIIIPFGINPLKIAVFRAVRLYMPLSLLWLLTRRYNKALWIFLWVSKRFELCHILFSWNTAAFYPVRKKKKACCRSDFKPLWMFPLSSPNDTAVFFGEIAFLQKVIDFIPTSDFVHLMGVQNLCLPPPTTFAILFVCSCSE